MSEDEPGPRRGVALLVLAGGIVWLGLAAALGLAGAQDYAALAGQDWRAQVVAIGSLVLQLLPPLAVAMLGFALVRRARAATLADDPDTGTLATSLAAGEARAARLAALLAASAAETRRQLGEVETLLAGVWAAGDDAAARHAAAMTAADARLAALAGHAAAVDASLAERARTVTAQADGAFEATSAALDATRAGVEAQTAALLASVDQARVAMDHIGGEAMRVMQKRLDALIEATDTLGQSLGEQDARSRVFVDTVERSFGVLDAKLGNAAATSQAALDALHARLETVQGAVHGLGAPLAGTYGAVGDLEAAVARLEQAAAAAVVSLGSDLPATQAGVNALAGDVGTLHERLGALAVPADAARATVAGIAAGLDAARGSAEAVETATGTAALTASNQLIEVLGRVREVAASTAGTMRDTLAGVVAEAEATLAETGTATARTAFGDPIRAALAGIAAAAEAATAAAQAAAERVSQRLLGLTRTVATVEARIDEVDTRYDVALRDDLARRSEGLVDALNAAAIDITRLLSIDVGDSAWESYLRGDKGVFARRAVRLLDRGTARRVERHFVHDAPFREQATRYITEFETLLKRVMPDREGKALAVTLLSSDIGKLYVALAQATEKLR